MDKYVEPYLYSHRLQALEFAMKWLEADHSLSIIDVIKIAEEIVIFLEK